MSYGLELFRADSSLGFSSDDVTWNQVDFFQVAGGSSTSNNYPSISGRAVLTPQFWVDGPPITRKAIAHTVTVSGTTVSVSGGSENAYIMVLMK